MDIVGIVAGLIVGVFAFWVFYCIQKHCMTDVDAKRIKYIKIENLVYIFLGTMFMSLLYYALIIVKIIIGVFNISSDLVNGIFTLVYAIWLIIIGLKSSTWFNCFYTKVLRKSAGGSGQGKAFRWCKIFSESSLLIYAMIQCLCRGEQYYFTFAIEIVTIFANENLSIQNASPDETDTLKKHLQDTLLFDGENKDEKDWIRPWCIGVITTIIYTLLLICSDKPCPGGWFVFSLWIVFFLAISFFQDYSDSVLEENKGDIPVSKEDKTDNPKPIKDKHKVGMLRSFFVGVSVGILSGIAIFSVHNKFRKQDK